MIFLWTILFWFIGIYLVISGIRLSAKEKRGNKIIDFFIVIIDILSDPISSEGIRVLFGGILIVVGLLLVF
ncbi:hypothetical protein J6TS2_38810 [Heyndrickxia sporothermodurans]|nr:hypothetical protein J6TS2_38810 [Heyndrickxia sporothermodurans]